MPAETLHPLSALAAEVSLSGYINLGSALAVSKSIALRRISDKASLRLSALSAVE
jgi:hypothetical protein